MNRKITSALMVAAAIALAGCDPVPKKSETPASSGSAPDSPSTIKQVDASSITPAQARAELARRKAARSSDEENHKIDVTLNCPIQYIYLDGSAILDRGVETIKIERSRTPKTKDGWGPIVTSMVEITSNGKKYDAHLVDSSSGYALVSYGSLLQDGVSRNLFMANFLIDLTTKKLRRTVLFSQNDQVLSSQSKCE